MWRYSRSRSLRYRSSFASVDVIPEIEEEIPGRDTTFTREPEAVTQTFREKKVVELRYERMAEDPDSVAVELAARLETPAAPLRSALAHVHRDSVGRFRRDLSEEQLADVLAKGKADAAAKLAAASR